MHMLVLESLCKVVVFVTELGGKSTNYRVFLFACTGRGPIIANMHITRERTPIFSPFFTDDNNKW
jgi:hypothetical protein